MRKQLFISFLLFLLIRINAAGQSPKITSFSPSSGTAGTLITINGTNLGNNGAVVYFGAAKATVVNQNNTQINVTVPSGANYEPITVTANGFTAYSEKPFMLTFNSATVINAQTFSNKIDFQTGSNVYGTVPIDLDGNGKTDIVAVNSGSNNFDILKNTSNSGNLSFAPNIIYPSATYPIDVAEGDLDGDGKPDIVVANFNTNTVSVYLNTSANNNITFSSQPVLQTGTNPYGVSIADFDGDGRPDVAITNEASFPATILVFRNITTATGSISFAPGISLPVGYYPRSLTTADIDGDGKPDILVPNQGSGTISVLKNTSVSGNISFAPELVLNTSEGSSPESITTGDFDGDGKLDVAVANNNSPGTISVFKNNSSPGTISFSPGQDFATGTNPFSITSGDINGDGKPDIAVTNQVDNTVSVLVNSGGGNISFNPHIDYATGNYPRSANIADVNGDGKPDIIVGNSNATTVSVLLNNLTTALLPSLITFPPLLVSNVDPNANINPNVTSTNTETPIVLTSSNTAVATITPDGLVHLIAPGITYITATQTGDSNYSSATPVTVELIVTETQVITFPVLPAKISCDADFPANAVSTNNTLPLTYASSNTAVATISSQGVIHITGAGTTIISVSQNGNDLFETAIPKSQTLTVNAAITPAVVITADHTSICTGTPVAYSAEVNNVTGNLNYQWQVNGQNTGTSSPTFINKNVNATDVVQCIVTDQSSCMASGTSNSITGIAVNPYVQPTIAITSSQKTAFCAGTSVTFTAQPTNGGDNPVYQWQVNGINTGASAITFTTDNLNNGDLVTCTLTSNSPCLINPSAKSNSIKTDLLSPDNPVPSVIINASTTTTYAGLPVNFTASTINVGQNPVYQWQVNGVNAGSNSANFAGTTFNNGDNVTCTVFMSTGCTPSVISQPIYLKILSPLAIKIPNAFTPNNDGVNDYWDIPDLAYYPNCTVSVYSRYGMQLFYSKGYGDHWNGCVNGKPVPFGTYYYLIDLNNGSPKLSGYVAIIK